MDSVQPTAIPSVSGGSVGQDDQSSSDDPKKETRSAVLTTEEIRKIARESVKDAEELDEQLAAVFKTPNTTGS